MIIVKPDRTLAAVLILTGRIVPDDERDIFRVPSWRERWRPDEGHGFEKVVP
jgi:hypothetical protein